ncbi:hypothetical protein P692DRAFT_20139669 [Suillus brevipes Sb2]|nr:hypothetical protein P692DRAFT_20139669 [Suillus brevipes Sb2]
MVGVQFGGSTHLFCERTASALSIFLHFAAGNSHSSLPLHFYMFLWTCLSSNPTSSILQYLHKAVQHASPLAVQYVTMYSLQPHYQTPGGCTMLQHSLHIWDKCNTSFVP